MGSGKTTQGKKIARMMGYDFYDMDQVISTNEKRSIPDIFNTNGEDYFREIEKMTLLDLSHKEKVVISTGGGTPCHEKNLNFMKSKGLVIYLKMTPAALFSRLQQSSGTRPLLFNKSPDELKAYIIEKLTEREPFYNQAHMTLDGLERVDERVVNAIQRMSI